MDMMEGDNGCDDVNGIGGVRIVVLFWASAPSAHFLFVPTLIGFFSFEAAVGLIINTQFDTANKSSIRGSSNECNLIVK
jgi:hypothetical protein